MECSCLVENPPGVEEVALELVEVEVAALHLHPLVEEVSLLLKMVARMEMVPTGAPIAEEMVET